MMNVDFKIREGIFGDVLFDHIVDVTAEALRESQFYNSVTEIIIDVDKSLSIFIEKEEYCKCAFLKLLREELVIHERSEKKVNALFPNEM